MKWQVSVLLSGRIWEDMAVLSPSVLRLKNFLCQRWYSCPSSVPSLAAGLFFGSLAGLGAYQLSQNPSNVWISLITSGTLTAVMGTRFYNSGKFMPAGLIAGVSLLMVGRLALKMVEKPHEK
ncbi:transmembrane protein 14C-like isoform 1-T1 [Podargus strigoides]